MQGGSAGGAPFGTTRRRPFLVWLLVALGAAAVATSVVLAFVVIPAGGRHTETALAEVGEFEHMLVLVRGQSNDERAFLLAGDRRFLAQHAEKDAAVRGGWARLRAVLSPHRRHLVDDVEASYERYLDHHRRVVALADEGRHDEAVTVALADERTERLQTERLLEEAHEKVVRESRRQIATVRHQALGLVAALLALGFVPAVAAVSLRRAYRRLQEQELASLDRRRLAEAQRVAGLGSWEYDLATQRVTWSDQMFRLFGYEPGEREPSIDDYMRALHPDDRARIADLLAAEPDSVDRFAMLNRVVRADGTMVWLETQGEVVRGADSTPTTVVGTALDVTQREQTALAMRRNHEQLAQQAAEMERRAYHDSLTGLPNRVMLVERLDEALSVGAYGEQPTAALAFLDLDRFKQVNDSLGHVVGDRLLVHVGRRLSECAGGNVVVVRLGGDEFAVLMLGFDEGEARRCVDRMLAALEQPFQVDGRQLTISASAGLATVRASESAAELLRDADVALHAAKDAGRAQCVVFDPAMRAAVVDRLALETDLRAAIAAAALDVHYQPIVEATTGKVVKLEALVRWRHPVRGAVYPDEFIPLAEDTGLVVPLGLVVLRKACEAAASFDPDVRMAVNLSARQLAEPDLVASVASVLEATGLPAGRLVLEVTESVVMANDVQQRGVLDELRGLGVGLAIDDFGTGYSSLSRLRLLPVDELKIDKSFIDEVDTEGDRAPVVAAVIALAHSLGRTVVAEGVETTAQLAALAGLRCDHIQGYLFSRPLPVEELRERMAGPAPFADVLTSGDPTASTPSLEGAVGGVVREGGGLEARLRPLLAELTRVTRMDIAYLTRVDSVRGTHEILLVHDDGSGLLTEGRRAAWIDTLCRRVLSSPYRASDDVSRDYPDSADVVELGLRGYAVAPVTTSAGRLAGTLCVASRRPRAVDHRTVALMDVFAGLIAEALEQLVAPSSDGG